VTVSRQADASYLLTPGTGVSLRIGGTTFTTPQAVSGVMNGLVAYLGAGNDQLTLNGAAFTRSVILNLGDGNNTFTVQDSAVGGALRVVCGAGDDTITFAGTAVGVGGELRAGLGNGTNLVQTNLARATFGSFNVFGGPGNDTLSVTQNNLTFTTLLGGLSFADGGGNGTDTVARGDGTARLAVASDVVLVGGGAGATVTIGGSRFDARNLKLNFFGNGTNSVTSNVTELHVAKNLTLDGGLGTDILDVNGTDLRVGGSIGVAPQQGVENIQLTPSDLLWVGRGVTIQLNNSEGSNQVTLDAFDTLIGGPVHISTSTGDTGVRLAGFNSLAVDGDVTLRVRGGSGTVQVASNSALVIPGSVTIRRDAGQGISSLLAGGTGDAVIGGSVTMTGGATQNLQMSGVVVGGVTMTGAPGVKTSIMLQSNGPKPLNIHGPVRITAPSLPGQGSLITVTDVIGEGPWAIYGGKGSDRLRIDGSAFLGAVKVALRAGADRFELEQQGSARTSTFAGPVLLLGGGENDIFLIGGDAAANAIAFRNAVTVDGEAGTDTLTIGTQATFDPAHPLVALNIA
jgi:trimeric autotransporter adhesin